MPERRSDQPLHCYRLSPAAPAHKVTQSDDCVVALRALGESTRARIVGILIEAPLDVGEISKRVGVSQYNASKHLRILREAGLLELEKQGRRHLYALPDTIRRSAAEASILDLGCCSFQFDSVTSESHPRPSGPRRRRSAGRPPRITR